MADEEPAPSLAPPRVRRRDTVTSALQRELLGLARAVHGDGGASPPQGEEQEQGGEQEQERAEAEHYRTLSPARASQLLAADAALGENDTASPTALRRLLRGMAGKTDADAHSNADSQGLSVADVAQMKEMVESSRLELKQATAAASPSPRRARRQSSSPGLERATANTRSPARKSPEKKRTRASPTKRASPPKQGKAAADGDSERRQSVTDSFAAGMFSSSLLNQQATDEPGEADPTAVEEEEEEKTGEYVHILEQTTLVDSVVASPGRRATIEPTDADSILAELHQSRQEESRFAVHSERRQTIASQPNQQSPTQVEARRSTLDPREISRVQDGSDLNAKGDAERRQTIGDNELEELNSVLGNINMSEDRRKSPSTSRVADVRKRTNAFDAAADEVPARKRVKATDGPSEHKSNDPEDSAHQSPSRHQNNDVFSSPSRNTRSRTRVEDKGTPLAMPLSPGQDSRRAPLRGILSARKRAKDQTTPTKSVNFGPPQGAEFNFGSPSTSMTPMNAHKARAMFPLDHPSSPDDEETSLNSSILDEADSRSPDPEPSQESRGNDENTRRSSLVTSRSPTRRRYSLRGVSPLDNQKEARRKRRASAIGNGSFLSTGISLPKVTPAVPVSQSSFLAEGASLSQTQIPYADSSESSDAGEDMEITGEHSFQASAALQQTIRMMATNVQSSARKASLDEDHTVELGSLGDLLAESAAYDMTSQPRGHDATLGTIQEETDSRGDLSRQSLMSIVSSLRDSDEEDEHNKSPVAVNLSSQFEAMEDESSTDGASNDAITAPSISFEELLAMVDLEKSQTPVTGGSRFFESDADSAGSGIGWIAASDACTDVVNWYAKEISSWSTGLTDVLPTLLAEMAPSFLGDEKKTADVKLIVKDLHATEAANARSGWCQWRAKMESKMAQRLTEIEHALEEDVEALKSSLMSESLRRESEAAAIKELIEREMQMIQLLDGIEEQQTVRNDFGATVATLEHKCAVLAMEENTLQTRLQGLEGLAQELEPVTASKASRTQHELLEKEEIFFIQESLSGWHVAEATPTLVRLTTKLDDVLFDVDVELLVAISAPNDGTPYSATLKARETIKRRKQSVYLAPDQDVILLVQRHLFDSARLAVVVGEARGRAGAQDRSGRLCLNTQLLENYVSQAFGFLRELRRLSTSVGLSLEATEKVLWAQFIKFPGKRNQDQASKFRVGVLLTTAAPFTSDNVRVEVNYGPVCSHSCSVHLCV